MADHLLLGGMRGATLRPLAAAAGISDRMLLYYFADKDDVLSETLHRIAERMAVHLDAAIPLGEARPFDVLLEEVLKALASEVLEPYMHLWLELAASASRGLQPHLRIAGQIADGLLEWTATRLELEACDDRSATASSFVVLVEGMYLLAAIGRPVRAKA